MGKRKTNVGGQVDPVRGPFTFWVDEVPAAPAVNAGRKLEDQVGPDLFLMMKDGDGNDYLFAEISPLVAPEDVTLVLKRLNKKGT